MILDRRSVLLSAAACSSVAVARLGRIPKDRRLGIQLYMLGPDAVRDLPTTLAKVREIGFEDVELPSLLGKTPAVLARMLSEAGLGCPSVHVPLAGAGFTLAEPDRVRDALQMLGARYATVPMAPFPIKIQPGEQWSDAVDRGASTLGHDGWRRIALALNAASTHLASAGLSVGYHNHDFDLRALAGSQETPLDILLRETRAEVVFELDIGWAAVAGVDPAKLLRKHRDRFRMLHLKDAGPTKTGDPSHLAPAAPGAGGVDWAAIAAIVRRGTIQHMFVEQEPPFAGARIEAARAGYEFFARRLS